MTGEQARRRMRDARIARLATLPGPHLVPVCLAVHHETIYSAVDDKPKRGSWLRRLENISRDPAATVLADHYEEDWSRLWWVRADCVGRVSGPPDEDHARGVELLRDKYPQYGSHRLSGPVIVLAVVGWSWWEAGADGAGDRNGDEDDTSGDAAGDKSVGTPESAA